MDREDFTEMVKTQPFEPFRMVLTSGESFDVRHPELVMLGRRSVIVGLASDVKQDYYDRTTTVSLLHVVRLEKIVSKPTDGNGAG